MKLSILLKPNAKHEKIEIITPQEYRVSVKAPPTEGKANQALIQLLAKHLKVPQSKITIQHGLHSRKKVVKYEIKT